MDIVNQSIHRRLTFNGRFATFGIFAVFVAPPIHGIVATVFKLPEHVGTLFRSVVSNSLLAKTDSGII